MRLELGTFPVHDVCFGGKTRWADGVLEIDREAALAAVREDGLVASARLEIARPGDSVRDLVNVRRPRHARVDVLICNECGRGLESSSSVFHLDIAGTQTRREQQGGQVIFTG